MLLKRGGKEGEGSGLWGNFPLELFVRISFPFSCLPLSESYICLWTKHAPDKAATVNWITVIL